jgi:hypothetical protein
MANEATRLKDRLTFARRSVLLGVRDTRLLWSPRTTGRDEQKENTTPNTKPSAIAFTLLEQVR